MITYLKGAAIALVVAGTALATSGFARADDYYGRNGYDNRDRGTISIGLGNIAFGYRDGYWDNGHQWHHWRHNRDYRSYRDENGSHYYNGYHNRYDNDGWQQN